MVVFVKHAMKWHVPEESVQAAFAWQGGLKGWVWVRARDCRSNNFGMVCALQPVCSSVRDLGSIPG